MARGLRIVVADDDPDARAVTVRYVRQSAPGCAVYEARDGKQAVELMSEHRADIAVLDLMMPKLGGAEAAREGRKLGVRCYLVTSQPRLSRVDEEAASKDDLESLIPGWLGRRVPFAAQRAWLRVATSVAALPIAAVAVALLALI